MGVFAPSEQVTWCADANATFGRGGHFISVTATSQRIRTTIGLGQTERRSKISEVVGSSQIDI